MFLCRFSAVPIICLAWAGCAGGVPIPAATAPDLSRDAVLFVGPVGLSAPEHGLDDFLALDASMRHFVEQLRPGTRSASGRIDALIDALFHSERFRVEYTASTTYSARDTFQHRSGNCLSVTALFIALAREMDLDARFLDVYRKPTWQRGSGVFVDERHISAVVRLNSAESVIVDFDTRSSGRVTRTARISDRTALAQFYNNLATHALQQRRHARAYQLFRQAVAADARLPYVWSNIGTLYSRVGHLERAENAYLYALNLDRNELSAMTNLVMLYRRTGRPELARIYLKQVERYRRRNPYYLHALATRALQQGAYEKAERYALRAIELKGDEASFRILLRRVQARLRISRPPR